MIKTVLPAITMCRWSSEM